MKAFLALGSNLGDRMSILARAVAELPDVVAVSSVYETEPIGGPVGQPSFLNLVVELDTRLSPRELLEVAQGLEAVAGRVRAVRFGPRTLDIDVLIVGDLVVDEPDLVVPHQRMADRRFVMVPLAELAPDLAAEVAARSSEDRATGDVRLLGPLPPDPGVP